MGIILIDGAEGRLRDLGPERLGWAGELIRLASPEAARQVLDEREIVALVLDAASTELRVEALLAELAESHPRTCLIALVSESDMQREHALRRAGAHVVLEREATQVEWRHALRTGLRRPWLGGLVGCSSGMARIKGLVRRVADTPTTVLVCGESGVGKELVARSVHEASSRRDGPFVPVHCGALSAHLLESELFGHVKGAFTDAVRDRPGCFERAAGGTLFLDEIGTMTQDVQVRMLRVLQEREVVRVGDSQPRPVDVRIVAATNQALEELVAAGRFRADLYYRLSVFRLQVAPLRDRHEDVESLAEHFVEELAERPVVLGAAARDALRRYTWPGNVRELRNVIERGLIVAGERQEVLAEDLQLLGLQPTLERDQPLVNLPEEGLSLPDVVNEIERDLITRALQRVNGSRAEAARLLGLKRTTLVQKIKRQNIDGVSAA
ncbi:MAG: sigma-54 dependent transcriptional regulator [Acidobacteriota bacterium]